MRNSTISNQISTQSQNNFKAMNNLLTLQDNHVEDFFQYHGVDFLTAFEKLIEDVMERTMSQMLSKLEFVLDTTSGHISLQSDCLREYERITQENIEIDLQNIMESAVNEEVVLQRQMAKSQYMETQGFGSGGQMAGGAAVATGVGMSTAQMQYPQQNIQGNPQTGGMNQQMMNQQNALGNSSGYPVPPQGQDNYGNPYWIDPNTGQMTYSPPSSGLGLGKMITKGAAWAKWLA
jgi:hypothetical protein